MEPQTTIYKAAAVRDARGVDARPGAVAVREGKVLAAGPVDEVRRQVGKGDQTIDLGERFLLPALVNAHAHLDLTAIGPRPYEGDFIKWIEMVMKLRPRTPEAIADAVRQGLAMSRAAGVGWLGDIAGSDEAARARVFAEPEFQLDGVSYLECFGLGATQEAAAAEAVARRARLQAEQLASGRRGLPHVELQPHAPYSAGLQLYAAACTSAGAPTTHLAETLAEDQFVRSASGPFADLLHRLGKWDASIKPTGQSPIQYLREVLDRFNWLVAHCNYVDDADIDVLRRTGTTVAYCPIASDYFGHRQHRYRDMLDARVNVCIGTDSILCQPLGEPQPLGILPQMRYLWRRDATGPIVLLHMATVNGIYGLAMSGENHGYNATLAPGAPAKLIAVRFDPADPTDPLTQVLRNDYPVEPVIL